MQGIYRILNLVNSKWYVGSTKDIKERWAGHQRDLQKGCNSKLLQNDFNKYGARNFILEILEEVIGTRDDAYAREQEYLDIYFPIGELYNISPLAQGGASLGHKVTQATRDKMSKLVGKYYETHDHVMKGKRFSEEHCQNISKAKTGVSHPNTEEWVQNIRMGLLQSWQNNPDKRMVYSKQMQKNWQDSEFRIKMLGGQPSSEEMRETALDWWNEHPKEREKQARRARIQWENPEFWDKMSKVHAKPYPAFHNTKTGECIPAGCNLSQMCREHNLNLSTMGFLSRGNTKQTRDGWRVTRCANSTT